MSLLHFSVKCFTQPINSIVALLLFFNCSSEDEIQKKENLSIDLLLAVNALRYEGCQCGQDYMPSAPLLIWNNSLEVAADNHVNDMYFNKYFSHLSQDGSTPIIRAQEAGYQGYYVGENIARGYTRLNDVMEGWKESESHCKAMMDTLYNEMGAAEIGGYWVLDLGRSK